MRYDTLTCPACRLRVVEDSGVITTHVGPSGLVCRASREPKGVMYRRLLEQLQRARAEVTR